MGLSDLISKAKELFSPGSTAIRTAPGQTYGPSVSRTTRTPIQYTTDLPPEEAGIYTAPTDFNKKYMGAVGQIQINPLDKDSSPENTLRHEDTHALLANLSDNRMEDLARTNPYFEAYSNILSKKRGGEMQFEVPAYASEYSGAANSYDVPLTLRDKYLAHTAAQLHEIDPNIANTFLKLNAKTK